MSSFSFAQFDTLVVVATETVDELSMALLIIDWFFIRQCRLWTNAKLHHTFQPCMILSDAPSQCDPLLKKY